MPTAHGMPHNGNDVMALTCPCALLMHGVLIQRPRTRAVQASVIPSHADIGFALTVALPTCRAAVPCQAFDDWYELEDCLHLLQDEAEGDAEGDAIDTLYYETDDGQLPHPRAHITHRRRCRQ